MPGRAPRNAVFLAQLALDHVASLFRVKLRLVHEKHDLIRHARQTFGLSFLRAAGSAGKHPPNGVSRHAAGERADSPL